MNGFWRLYTTLGFLGQKAVGEHFSAPKEGMYSHVYFRCGVKADNRNQGDPRRLWVSGDNVLVKPP